MTAERHRLVNLDDLFDGEMRGFRVAGTRVLVARIDDRIYAYRDRCAHLGLPLSTGKLEGTVLTCREHHYQYDIRTGSGVNPRSAKLEPIPVSVVDGQVIVEVASREAGR